jgi:hypothetical protein
MASYKDHKSTGLGWWLVASLALFFAKDGLGLSDEQVLLAIVVGLPATLLGAGFPDVDIVSSVPHRRLRLALFAVVFVFSFGLLVHPEAQAVIASALARAELSTLLAPLGALLLALMVGALAVFFLVFFLPPHRGATHRWPLALAVALLLAAALSLSLRGMAARHDVVAVVGVSACGFFLLGFASHLYRDGLLTTRRRRR